MQQKTVNTDGAELYCEVRGQGPALLMISGAGDGAYYGLAGDLLTQLSVQNAGHPGPLAHRIGRPFP